MFVSFRGRTYIGDCWWHWNSKRSGSSKDPSQTGFFGLDAGDSVDLGSVVLRRKNMWRPTSVEDMTWAADVRRRRGGGRPPAGAADVQPPGRRTSSHRRSGGRPAARAADVQPPGRRTFSCPGGGPPAVGAANVQPPGRRTFSRRGGGRPAAGRTHERRGADARTKELKP